MQRQVMELVDKGKMKLSMLKSINEIDEYVKNIKSIAKPIDDDDAGALLKLLPDDSGDYFGLSWSLLHVIESCPDLAVVLNSCAETGPWISELRSRLTRKINR